MQRMDDYSTSSAGVAGQADARGQRLGAVRRKRPNHLTALTVVLTMLLGVAGLGLRGGAAQEEGSTPDAEDGRSPNAQVIGQGLAFFDSEVEYRWRVREIAPPVEEEAGSGVAVAYSFLLQRTGATVIRNDISQRRGRIEPGEAYYISADDPYTRYANGDDPSTLWLIEIVNVESDAAELEGEVVYEGGGMSSVPAGTWDLELVRNILQPGEAAELPAHEGPALVLSSFGEIQTTTAGGESGTIDTAEGQLSVGPLVLRNNGDRPVVYLVAYIGDRVLGPDETPEAEAEEAVDAEGTPETAGTPVAEVSGPEADDDEDGLTNGEEEELGTDPALIDSDGDGLADAEEVNDFGTDPTNPDTDGDDLDDGDEIQLETDPSIADSDNDGFEDGEEVLSAGSDPNDAESTP